MTNPVLIEVYVRWQFAELPSLRYTAIIVRKVHVGFDGLQRLFEVVVFGSKNRSEI